MSKGFEFIFNSILLESFKIFSSPSATQFVYSDSKSLIENLYGFTRKTTKRVTTIKIPQGRNKTCCIIGYIFYIIPEFILRKFILGPLLIIVFGLLLMTSWLMIFIFIPVLYLVNYVIKTVAKVITVFFAFITAISLTLCLLSGIFLYLNFVCCLLVIFGLFIFIIYPILIVLRVIILSIVTIIYYLLRLIKLSKKYCFIIEKETLPS